MPGDDDWLFNTTLLWNCIVAHTQQHSEVWRKNINSEMSTPYVPRLQEVLVSMSACDLERCRLLRRIGVGTRRWCGSKRGALPGRKRRKNWNELAGERWCSLSNSNISLADSTSSTSSSSEPGNALYTHDWGLGVGVHSDDSFSGVLSTDSTRSSHGLAPNGRSSPNERELAACECKFDTWWMFPCE